MEVLTRAKKRRLEEEEEEQRHLTDWISRLPDDVLGDIVTLLPTRAGARTQVLSSRWRHIWRSAPLNVDLQDPLVGWRARTDPDHGDDITDMLSTHPGPGRRFSIPKGCFRDTNANHAAGRRLEGWLRSPALENLQELELDLSYQRRWSSMLFLEVPLPASVVYRFSSSLRVASFGCCTMPEGYGGALRFPVLEQLTLFSVNVSESSLHALLAGCSALQSLLLYNNYGFSRLQIVSPSLRSIGVRACPTTAHLKFQLILEDTPCLQRLLVFQGTNINTSVVSAPRLGVLGGLFDITPYPRLQFQSTIFQGSTALSATLTNVMHSVKVLALSEVVLRLDDAIDAVKCFPSLEKLYIKATRVRAYHVNNNVWYHEYQKLIGSHEIRLRKIVLANYQGSDTHIDFVKFFISKARVLESMRLEVEVENFSEEWVARQRRLLDIEKRAWTGAWVTFVRKKLIRSLDLLRVEQVHDLSINPFEFERFH